MRMNKLLICLKQVQQLNFKKEKAKLDRESKKELKSMDVLGKLAVEEEKQNAEDSRTAERNLKDIMEKGED